MDATTLDCSDIERYLGKPVCPAPMNDPFGPTDIRRWVQAMHYPNRLHYDKDYAAESLYGRLVAPQSFAVAMDDGHGSSPSCVGSIPGSHLLFGGDEWWFYGPRIFAGDLISNERIPFDYAVKETRFAGPTCFQRGDNFYRNQHGELIAKQRSTAIRYRADAGRDATPLDNEPEPSWTDAELKDIEDRKFRWIETLHELGHDKRYWDDVSVGDRLPERVIGPHSIVSLATEWRAYLFTGWGTITRRTDLDMAAMGFVEEMAGLEQDPEMERINPELTDGAYVGPSRGHMFKRWAQFIGMPREYGYGASMGAWILDYLAGWAGEHGMVVHSVANYRGPALVGDVTVMTAEIIDKMTDDTDRPLVQVDFTMKNQLGVTMATAKAEIQLARR